MNVRLSVIVELFARGAVCRLRVIAELVLQPNLFRVAAYTECKISSALHSSEINQGDIKLDALPSKHVLSTETGKGNMDCYENVLTMYREIMWSSVSNSCVKQLLPSVVRRVLVVPKTKRVAHYKLVQVGADCLTH